MTLHQILENLVANVTTNPANDFTDVIDDEKWIMLTFGKGDNIRKMLNIQRAWNDKNVLIGKGGRKPRFYFIVRRKDGK